MTRDGSWPVLPGSEPNSANGTLSQMCFGRMPNCPRCVVHKGRRRRERDQLDGVVVNDDEFLERLRPRFRGER